MGRFVKFKFPGNIKGLFIDRKQGKGEFAADLIFIEFCRQSTAFAVDVIPDIFEIGIGHPPPAAIVKYDLELSPLKQQSAVGGNFNFGRQLSCGKHETGKCNCKQNTELDLHVSDFRLH